MSAEITAASVPAAPRPVARRGAGAAILGSARLLRTTALAAELAAAADGDRAR